MEAEKLMLDFGRAWRDHCTISVGLSMHNNINMENVRCIRPNASVKKINCDAAMESCFSFIATVAQDWRGNLVFSYSKR